MPKGVNITENHFEGRAGNDAAAYGGNANLGDQSGADIRIGTSPQSLPTNKATTNRVSGNNSPHHKFIAAPLANTNICSA